MDNCCQNKEHELTALRGRQARVLWIVLVINAIMFVLEMSVGLLARSVALQADSLDMLGDTLVYGFSLYVVARSARWRAGAALLKGGIMAAFGVGVLLEAFSRLSAPAVPIAPLMGGMALLALLANAVCLALLTRHRADDINLRSTWLCSRNDIVANVGVLLAAGAVVLTRSMWPDLIISLVITGVFLQSAASVINGAIFELRMTERVVRACPTGTCPADACVCPSI
jgi:Co/Zn/Cd efflux system component